MAQISYGTITITDTNDIAKIENWYLATDLSNGVTRDNPASGHGTWTTNITNATLTSSFQYLWNYEKIYGTGLNGNDVLLSQTDPIIIGRHGQNGVDGNSILSIDEYYQATNSTTNPGANGWVKNSLVVPTSTNKYLWNYQVINYSKSSPEGSYTDARIIGIYGDKGEPGTPGTNGINTATVYLYQRKNTAPNKPSNTLTYTFETKALTGTINNGWNTSLSSLTGTDPIWIIAAVPSSNGVSDTITESEWSTPIKMAQDGTNGQPGTAGFNQATVYIYKRAASATKPANSTYTFETGEFTVSDDWQKTIPASSSTNKNPCWVSSAVAIGNEATATLVWNNPSVLVENGQNGTSPTVEQISNGVKITDADGNVTTITNGSNGQSYYTFVRYSANSNGSNYQSTPDISRPYIGVYSGTKSSPPAYDDSGWTWSKYIGTDGVSVTSVRELYYLTTGSAPSKPTSSTNIYSDDRTNNWTSIVPSYIVNGNYYLSLETSLSNNTKVWSDVVLDKALTDSNKNAYNAYQAANRVENLLGGHFVYGGAITTATPGGARVIEQIKDGTTDVTDVPSKWLHNVTIGSNGIALRYNEAVMAKLAANQGSGDTALKFYQPPTVSGSTTTQGSLAMELSTEGLSFYDGSTVNGGNIQAQFGSSGAIQSGDYAISATTDKFSTYGTKIDLVHGEIFSPYFRLSQGSVSGGPVAGIYMSGTFESTGAIIGHQKISNSDSNAYWKIGYMTDTNQDKLTYQKADNNGFIELAPSSTFIFQKNKIHTGWFGNNGYLTYPRFDEKYYDLGMNLPTSLTDKFLYIRYNTGTNLSEIYQNDDGWTYPFYVDADGKVHAQNFYIGNSTTPIGGGAGTIAEKLINGAGSATQPVYFRSDSGHVGEVTAISYTIGQSVPSDSIWIKSVSTIGNGNAITSVSFNSSTGIVTATKGTTFLTSYTETDPTVPSWAKAATKPSYTLSEITGADDVKAIEDLTGTSGFLKKTAANAWTLDTNTYLTSYTETDPIFVASAAHGITSSDISNWNSKTSNTGTVTSVRVQASSPLTSTSNTASSTTLDTTIKFSNQNANLVLAGPSSGTSAAAPVFRSLVAADIPGLAWSKITSGNDDLKAIEALTGTSGFLKKTASNTWSLDTTTYVPTSRTVNGHALSGNVTITASDIGLSNVTNYSQITKIGESGDGKLRVWTGNPDGNNYTDVEVHITAYDQSTVSKAEALNLSAKVGDTNKPVYFKADGKPYAINYTIDKSVPSDALFTDTTYEFADSYNASTNKGATVTTVNNAIGNLDVNAITGTAGQTITSISETNGKISATYSNISITKSQISDFPTELTPASHTHGNIQNNGILQTNDITIASGDKLVVTDSSNSDKIARASLAFTNSTTKFLREDGQFATPNYTTNTDSKVSSSNSTSKLFLIGTTSQNSSGQAGYSNSAIYATDGALVATTYNGLTLTKATTGFTIAGGTTSKTLTVNENYTLGAACAKGLSDSSSASAIGTGTSVTTERDIYYGLPTINNSHTYTSSTTIYAPTAGGTANTQALVGNGTTTAPKWVNISPSISITAGTASATPKINVTVLGQSGTARSLTTASTSVYGATKLSSTSSSTEQGLAATPKLVYDSINNAASNYVAKSGDTMTGTLTTPELVATKITAKDVNVTHLLTAEGIQTKNWTTVNMATIDGSFYIVPTVTAATASVKYTTNGTLEFTATNTSTFATNSLFINGDATNWTVNSLIMITGLIHIGNEDVSIGTLKGTLTAVNPTNKTLTLGGTITSSVGTNTPSILGLLTMGSTYNCKDIKVSIYSYYNNSQENLLGIMMTTAGTKNRTYIDIYDGTHKTNAETDTQDSSTKYTKPVVRIGNLRGLPIMANGDAPTGWGIYTTNGYFEGIVSAKKGHIGASAQNKIVISGDTTNAAIYSGSHSTLASTNTGFYIGTDGISIGDNFKYIGGTTNTLTVKNISATNFSFDSGSISSGVSIGNTGTIQENLNSKASTNAEFSVEITTGTIDFTANNGNGSYPMTANIYRLGVKQTSGNYTFKWYKDNGTTAVYTSTGYTSSYTATSSGIYTVTIE